MDNVKLSKKDLATDDGAVRRLRCKRKRTHRVDRRGKARMRLGDEGERQGSRRHRRIEGALPSPALPVQVNIRGARPAGRAAIAVPRPITRISTAGSRHSAVDCSLAFTVLLLVFYYGVLCFVSHFCFLFLYFFMWFIEYIFILICIFFYYCLLHSMRFTET
ncbi:hypothetical protein [Pseudochelatococcus contaminans]|uniref:Uncharacterized protein n=1 Tax=Pseudochelatococcus contaminans TaxID=1538103 RepID=A0A7W5Z5R4_9HYPH|nr:hypothetical protein [Pseudochelatococcus contaminans]MBB3810628.1 hypothetical protein [Pseudochelatococcus contaminans]